MSEPGDLPSMPLQIVSERFHLVIPSLPHWIEPTVDYLRQKALLCGACQETRSGKLVVALQEALSNSLLHGNLELSSELKEQGDDSFAEALAQRSANPALTGRTVDIRVDFDGEVCTWVITDQGNGFDVDAVLARCLSDDPEVLLSSGRGILMMKSFLDDVRFDLGGRRVTLMMKRASGAERRRETRMPVNLSFQVTPVQPDGTVCWADTYHGVSRNFSEHGVALLTEQLAHTPRVLIGIPGKEEIVYVPAEIKHARPMPNGGMELGCSFVPPAAEPAAAAASFPERAEIEEAIADLLEGHETLPPHERRLHPRVVFNEAVLIFRADRPQPLTAYARDLSKGGISFIAQEVIEGEITIGLSPRDTRPPIKVRSRVMRCAHIEENFYDVGAVFLRLERPA